MRNNAYVSKVHLASGGESLISSSGVALLAQTAMVSGLTKGLSASLASWRKPLATHDPGKIVLDLALAIAAGGDCLADVALLRAQSEVFAGVPASTVQAWLGHSSLQTTQIYMHYLGDSADLAGLDLLNRRGSAGGARLE